MLGISPPDQVNFLRRYTSQLRNWFQYEWIVCHPSKIQNIEAAMESHRPPIHDIQYIVNSDVYFVSLYEMIHSYIIYIQLKQKTLFEIFT